MSERSKVVQSACREVPRVVDSRNDLTPFGVWNDVKM